MAQGSGCLFGSENLRLADRAVNDRIITAGGGTGRLDFLFGNCFGRTVGKLRNCSGLNVLFIMRTDPLLFSLYAACRLP